MLDWKPFVELVHAHRRFLLTTHVRPDGDGLGSMLALGDTLRRKGNEVRLVIASTLPGRYRFLDPEGAIEHCDEQNPPRIDADLDGLAVTAPRLEDSYLQLTGTNGDQP